MNDHNDKIFTADDIIRYHSGKMPEREMHAMEKAALEDPFLADALEGYPNTLTPTQDLADIRERLSKKKRNKVIPIVRSYDMWLKIAAVLLLILGAGYMTYYFNSNKQEQRLAKNEDTMRIDKRAFVKQADTNKIIIKDNNDLADKDSKGETKQAANKISRTITSTSSATSDSVKQNDLASGKDIVKNNNISTAPSMQEKQLNAKADTSTKPVAYARNDERIKAKATNNGDVKSNRGDTARFGNVASIGYDTRRPKLKKVAALRPKPKYKEVVAINTYKKDKQAEDNDSLLVINKSTENEVEDDLPRVIGIDSFFLPVKGWMDYNKYLSDNSSLFSKCKGQMVLSFIINKKGYPIKIDVEKSLSLECDEKAMKLLRDGPKWISVPNKRCNITLQF
jgi:hypothetical protein